MNAKEKVIGEVPGNVLGMASDLFHKLQHGKIRPIELEFFLKRKNPFTIETIFTDWQRFYRDFFDMKVDFSEVKIPSKQEGIDRLIVVARGITPNQVFEACERNFPCEKYDLDLNEETKGRNEREPTKHYAIWVCDNQEADEGLKSMCANILKEKNIKTETLIEREVHELKFYFETGKHLDEKGISLVAGSRDSDGDVPDADWYDGEFRVGWCNPQFADSRLRARAVVSL